MKTWLEVAAATIAVIGGTIAAIVFLVDRGEDLIRGDTSQIEVRQVVVVNGRGDGRLVDGEFRQIEAKAPQLDITVRNTGTTPVLLTEVGVTVEDSARLTVCEFHTGDIVTASREYAVELPVLPRPGERTVRHPLHQEVQPGAVDRFKILFRPYMDSWGVNYVYALTVALYGEDSSGAIDVGRYVLSVPESVNRGGLILPEGPEPFGVLDERERLLSTWCARRNIAELGRLLRHEGRRSESMAALADFQVADWWPEFVDRRSPRASVGPLLREWPDLAVFAAEQSGDRGLVAETRRRAAAILLRSAEEALNSEYAYGPAAAVLDARYAFLFSPSQEATATIARAETRMAAVESEAPAGE